jgi:peroxiredoxin
MRPALAALSLLFLSACAAPSRNASENDFALPDLAGKTVRLADFRGKVVLVDFWATWCQPCRESLPVYTNLSARLHDRGLVVLGINEDDQADGVSEFARKNGANYPVLLDARRSVYNAFHVRALPTAFIFDREGRLQGRWSNFDAATAAEETKAVDALLVAAPGK